MSALLFWYLIGGRVSAEEFASQYLHRLARARSGTEVEALTEGYDQLRIARTACRIQRREHAVPSACYERLQLETKLGLAGRADATEKLEKLDAQCARASLKLHINSPLGPSVSAYCVAKVRAAQSIRDYRAEEEWADD